MGAFEHMMTLVSFVLALAIAHLLIGVVEIVRAGSRVRHSWVHAGWMAYGFLMPVGWWVGLWDLHVVARWSTWSVLLNLLGTTTCYLFVAFVCPKISETGPVDLGAFHDANRRRYLGFGIANSLFSVCVSLLYSGLYDVPGQVLQAIDFGAGLAALVLAYVFPNVWVQRAMVVVALASVAFFFAVGDPVLS
ncbi:MAG TPA: hypothetical protein VHU87_06695 [Rhizomicrobium sp.]|jgi:hypothetical protein|nr:hypothetical protein [Rhizomicrobium sp.]